MSNHKLLQDSLSTRHIPIDHIHLLSSSHLFIPFLFLFTDVVKFDNSFSLFSSKSLDYWVEVLEPLGDDEEVAFQETAHDFTVFD